MSKRLFYGVMDNTSGFDPGIFSLSLDRTTNK